MRKEIIGILLFFLVIFTLVSLLSYSPTDPSINNTRALAPIENMFGIIGAHVSGFLIGLFGLGAFWVPVLLLIASLQILGRQPPVAMLSTFFGGLMLIVSTGGLFSLEQHDYAIFGRQFSAGGLVGIPFKAFLVSYANTSGAVVILFILWLIGLILATPFSLIAFARRLRYLFQAFGERVKTLYLKHKERKLKAKKRQAMRSVSAKNPRKEIRIKAKEKNPLKPVPKARQEVFEFMRPRNGFQLPSVTFLVEPEHDAITADDENLRMQSKLLEKKLEDFGVKGEVMTVLPGPVITTFEYKPAPGIKINKIVSLADDLALTLRATSIRIVAPIPGKAAIGIEVPNAAREIVRFKEIVVSDAFDGSKSRLTICLGKDIVGNPVVADLARMPHLLIAGATGTGKSVALNTMICSLLFKVTPEEVKLILVDPKRIELSDYDGIPHLITPVVTDAKKATNALFWAVKEMERRYQLLSELKARNIDQYNRKVEKLAGQPPQKQTGAEAENGHQPREKLPYVVIVIDELADLMMVASRDVEVALMRLAQMARAAGLHLILATQRPSVDVLTGVIKANFPTRLSFQVSSKTDSRTIIDTSGAESLLGDGDMLFMPPGAAKLQRIHGAYITEPEINRIIDFLKTQKPPEYLEEVTAVSAIETPAGDEEDHDEKYDEAVALVSNTRQASISMIQRHLRIGYNRAARIIETMEKEGIVGPADGVKPREVLVRGYDDM